MFAASASWDKTIKIWNLPKKSCVRTLTGHLGRVYSVAFSPCGTKVLSASKDKTLKMWDVGENCKDDERCICTLEGHTRRVLHCSFSQRSFLAASASADMTVRVWDTVAATCIFILTGHIGTVHRCAFSVDGSFLVSASHDKTLRVWDIRDGGGSTIEVIRTHGVHSPYRSQNWGFVYGCSMSWNSRLVVSASSDKTVSVWDRRSHRELVSLKGHDREVNACCISPDGSFIVSASNDTMLRIWCMNKRLLKAAGGYINAHQLMAIWPKLSTLYGGYTQYASTIIRLIKEY